MRLPLGGAARSRGLNAAFGWWWADPIGALAMLPVILWQGWETLEEAREGEDDN
jgi:divalent metal cation (Fe/Co/Zn/Cd) transporter